LGPFSQKKKGVRIFVLEFDVLGGGLFVIKTAYHLGKKNTPRGKGLRGSHLQKGKFSIKTASAGGRSLGVTRETPIMGRKKNRSQSSELSEVGGEGKTLSEKDIEE